MSRYPDPKPTTKKVLTEKGKAECARIWKLYPEYTADQVVYYAYKNFGKEIYTEETNWDYKNG